MRKKFTMLLMSLLAFVGVAKAGVTDLPTMSEGGNITWYTIKNTRSGKYANYAGDAVKMTQVSTPSLSSLFYFTVSDAATAEGFTPVMIHNAVTANKLADFVSWTEAGRAWYLSTDMKNDPAAGLHITNASKYEGWNAFNEAAGSDITNYKADDAGSVFVIEAVDAATISELVTAYKTTAINALKTLGTAIDITAVETAINAVNVEGGNYGEFTAAVNAVVNNAVQYVAFRNSDSHEKRLNAYLAAYMPNEKGHGTQANYINAVWSLKYTGAGEFYLYNVNSEVYLGNPDSKGALTETPNAAYTFELIEANKVEFKSGGQTLHCNNHNGSGTVASGTSLTNYDRDDTASRWYVESDLTTLVSAAKTYAIAELEGDGLNGVCSLVGVDASLISAALTKISQIENKDYAALVAIGAEYKKVTDAIAAKDVVFQNASTGASARAEAYLGANAGTGKGTGNKNFSYDAVWNLVIVDGASFYLYNGLNNVYLKSPSSGELAESLSDAAVYTFEYVKIDENDAVELKSGNETLHLNSSCNLENYDWDDSASRWYVSTIDITAEIQTLIEANAANHADVPGLGQYTTAGYNALVAAKSTAKTVEEVEAAISAFKASKNLPVFTIDGVINYATGKSIYDDPVNPNDKGNTHYFKATDNYDKSMWWALDLTEETVSVVESVGIYNVGTGAGFWGSSTIKIADTSDGGAAEGIFLFYTTGNNSPIHAQNSGSVITRYGDTGKGSGSAWKFTYIGNTYNLNKLTDAHLQAAEALKEVYQKYASYEDDEFSYNATPALGEYAVSADGFKAALAAVKQYANASVSELAKADVPSMTTAAETLEAKAKELFASKNMPVFTISNGDVKDYAKGKSIYDNNSGTLYFKTTNLYDKTMWWALDQTATTVGVTENVGIYNVGTGNGFWGAASIKVAETSDAVEGEDDGLFLFYTTGNNTPIHFQADYSQIVRWSSTEATSGSAAKFTYVGNTYELNQLTPEFVDALDGMKTSYEKKSALYNAIWEGTTTVTEGTGVGQYHSNYTDFAEAMTNAGFLLASELSEQLKNADVAKLQAIKNNIDAFALNMPEEGNYYRIKGANDGKQNYLTGNVTATANGDRIALQADATDATIFQYVGGKLLAVESNLYVDLSKWTFQILASQAPNTEFAASTRNFNAYTINCGSFFHYDDGFLNRCGTDNCTEHDWLLEEVDAASVPANNNLLTDLANLNGASFRIYGERGFIYVADGNVKGTNSVAAAYSKNDNSHFAIVKIGESNYLYSVGAQKFVTKEGNIVALTDYPEHAFTIETAGEPSANYVWTIKVNNYKMNLSNSGTYGVYTNYETEDAGNRWALYTAGTFDQTEAAKMRKVSVNYTLGEKTITKNFGKKVDETFTVPSYDFATITSCKKGEEDVPANNGTYSVEISDAVTINVTIEENLPFKATAEGTPATWYYAQMHAYPGYGFYVSADADDKMVWYGDVNADSAKYVAGEVVPDSCLWGFAGNVVEGFKMVNKAASKAVISNGSGEVAVGDLANATAFELKTSQAGGDWFCLKYPTNNNHLNLDVNKKVVDHWSANDNGSSFFVTEYNKEYSLTVTAAGWATYYSAYRLAIPETVEAYIIDNVNGKSINLTKVEGVLPANTGIILKNAGTHTFETSAAQTADVSRNLLKGTAVKTLITAEENTNYYVLAMPEGEEAGLYKAALNKDANGNKVTENGVAFHNGANKAYLPVVVEVAAEAPAMYSFTRGDATDIEGSEFDAQGAVLIYDLAGRRVEKMVKGIYIVNGKKVLVK